MSFFDILGRLLNIFVRFIPRFEVIDTTHRGVCWLFGRWPVLMGPGVYVIWPVVMRFLQVPIYRQTKGCREKPATTKDGVSVVYDCGIIYAITDPKRQACICDDYDEIVQLYAMELVRDEITQYSFVDANRALLSRVVQKRVLRLLGAELEPYGIEPYAVKVPAFARTRALHHTGSAANIEVSMYDTPGEEG